MSSFEWLAKIINFPFSFRDKSTFLISSTPSLSSPFNGSSKRRISGSSMIACAIPRRWRIPSEYFPTCFLLSGSSPTIRIALRISSFEILWCIIAKNFRFLNPEYSGKNPGFSIIAPIRSGILISFPKTFPSIFILPDDGLTKPSIIFISIVFPEPFLPTNP